MLLGIETHILKQDNTFKEGSLFERGPSASATFDYKFGTKQEVILSVTNQSLDS